MKTKLCLITLVIFLLLLFPLSAFAADAPADGEYTVAVTLLGGSGRATVNSPTALQVIDGKMTATILWDSPNYTYMLVDGQKYFAEKADGNAMFTIPVSALDTNLAVSAETTAMSEPHVIDYTLRFDGATLQTKGAATMTIPILAGVVVVAAGIAIVVWKKRKKG